VKSGNAAENPGEFIVHMVQVQKGGSEPSRTHQEIPGMSRNECRKAHPVKHERCEKIGEFIERNLNAGRCSDLQRECR